MNNPDTELLFPLRVISNLIDIRGEEWKQLLEFINSDEATSEDQLAFVLTMVKLAGCVSCNSDSFRAMRGCTQCSIQAVRRFRGSDEELIALYNENRIEVANYMKEQEKKK